MSKPRTLNPYDMEERIHNLEENGGGGGGGSTEPTVVATAVSTGTEKYSDLLDTLYPSLGTNQAIEVDGILFRQVTTNQFSALSQDTSNYNPVLSVITLKESGSGYDFWAGGWVRNGKSAYATTSGLTIKLLQY